MAFYGVLDHPLVWSSRAGHSVFTVDEATCQNQFESGGERVDGQPEDPGIHTA